MAADREIYLAALETIERQSTHLVGQIARSKSVHRTASLCDRLNDLDTGTLLIRDLLARAGSSTHL